MAPLINRFTREGKAKCRLTYSIYKTNAGCPCTPPSSVETFSGKISASIGSSKEIAGLKKKKKRIL